MPTGDEYRSKAAEIMERVRAETEPRLSAELAKLAYAYLRLADQADRNALTDLVYETPSQAQQPQTPQDGKKDE
jgi:hypothetical protein